MLEWCTKCHGHGIKPIEPPERLRLLPGQYLFRRCSCAIGKSLGTRNRATQEPAWRRVAFGIFGSLQAVVDEHGQRFESGYSPRDRFFRDPETDRRAINLLGAIPCSECGIPVASTKETSHTHGFEKLVEAHLCFTDYFWRELFLKSDDPKVVRVAGTHYEIGDEDEYTERIARKMDLAGLGFSGAHFRIRWNYPRSGIVESHNMWCQGTIPENWRTRLPDNAIFEPAHELRATAV